MNVKNNLLRMLLILVATFLWGGVMSVYADNVAWVKYADNTLTFQYSEKTTLDTDEYWLNEGTEKPGWSGKYVSKVVFDPSFAEARPTTCCRWFEDFERLKAVEGIENLNTSDVTDMSYMFYGCSVLTSLDLSHFDTSDVTTMAYMFRGCFGLTTLDFSSFSTSKVTNMIGMFYECTGLNSLDLSSFFPWKVANMAYMFYGCTGLTSLKLTNFRTTKVKSMNSMFYDCNSLTTLDLSSFGTSNVENMFRMFYGCSNLATILVSDQFVTSGVTGGNGVSMFTGCTKLVGDIAYDESKTDQTYATYSGGYFLNVNYFRPWVKLADNTLTFQYGYKPTLGEGEYLLDNYVKAWDYGSKDWTDKCSAITTVVFDPSFAVVRPTTCSNWFYYFKGLTTIKGIEYLNTSKVTNMSYMFYCCQSLTSLDVSNFDTSNVTDMSQMFSSCLSLTSLDLSNFNTSKVTDMSSLFEGCRSFTSLDVSNFDTSKVRNMSNMFDYCKLLTSLDVSNFNTSNVTSMAFMFESCIKLTSLDLSNFDTSKVTSLDGMFRGCSGLTSLNLSSFNTSNVTSMSNMFVSCSSFTTLDLSNFTTPNLTATAYMFEGCYGLTTLNLSTFDTSKVTTTRCMFASDRNLKAIYIGDGFKVENIENIDNIAMFYRCPDDLVIYCPPLKYNSFSTGFFKDRYAVKPFVDINSKAEYGTLCVPVGSSLADGSFTGFDKLYQVTGVDKDKGTVTLVEAKSVKPGVAYVYHRYLEGVDYESGDTDSSSDGTSTNAPAMSVITFGVDASSTAVTEPKNEGSLLKGTFESMVAIGGTYIIQTDGCFHHVAEDNTRLKVGAYRAYLDLSSVDTNEAKTYQMVFEDDETTAVDGVSEHTDRLPDTYFDLMGRRVSAPNAGGVYIVNGKKVVYNR